jgi:hypothetical protein
MTTNSLEYQRKWREKNKEHIQQYSKDWCSTHKENKRVSAQKWRNNNKESNILAVARQRSKKYTFDFNITIDDIVIPTTCSILGIPLFWSKRKVTSNTPSIDRIDSSKGYVKGNIQIISKLANSMKQDASLDQLIQLGEWAKKIKLEIQ